MTRSRSRGKETRYKRAVRRQIDLHAAAPRWYAAPEAVLRAGDNIERFGPPTTVHLAVADTTPLCEPCAAGDPCHHDSRR